MSTTVSVSWLGVLIAFAIVFVMNFVYFGPKGFYPAWVRALGKDPYANGGEGQNMVPAFVSVTLAILAQAFVMDWLVQATGALYGHDVSLGGGILTGVIAGIGISGATSLGHRMFAGHGFRVWIIENGADVLGLAIMGAIFSFWS